MIRLSKQLSTQSNKPNPLAKALTALLAVSALSLTACGGGGSSSSNSSNQGSNDKNDNNGGNTSTAGFSESATWVVNTSANNLGDICYDFDSKAEVECGGVNWDIKLTNQARSKSLWTNSGSSGEGNGGAFGLLDWTDLQTYTNATTTTDGRDFTHHYTTDSTSGVFKEKPWYEYNLQDRHQLYPNNKVYLITTDSTNASSASSVQLPVYALQVLNYYNEEGKSGYQTLRWIDTAMPNKVSTQTFNASSHSNWVYIDLKTGNTVTKDGDWQVALKRNDLKLNGGDSGLGKVGGYVAKQPAGFYDADNKAIVSQFIVDNSATTLTDLTNTSGYDISADGVPWVTDGFSSVLNPSYSGTYPNLDYGWYTYSGMTHQLSAKPEAEAKGALIRSGEGNSYARIRLSTINNDTGEWTFVMDIQPAS